MAKRKNAPISVSPAEQTQAAQLFARYQQVTTAVRVSQNREEIEQALREIETLPAGAQMALLGLLAKEQTVEAADLLLALHAFAAHKETRKEARRALIRLEGAKVSPQWKAPSEPLVLPSTPAPSMNPPRFWKGYVSDLRVEGSVIDVGEVEVLLGFLQGEDYREVRVLGFLLDFWHEGVKDFFTRIESKRSFENFLAQRKLRPDRVKLKECSLAQGRQLLTRALAVHTRHGTTPSRDYHEHRSLVTQLLGETPDGEEKEERGDAFEEEAIELNGLSPTSVVATFLEDWVWGDYPIAYQLLAQDSSLREGLDKQAWVEKREAWADRYGLEPDTFEPALLHECETPHSILWLPNPWSARPNAKEIEVGWSFETEVVSLDERLPELPEPTVTYQATGRHWFWANVTLVQENGEWRIQTMTDAFAQAQALSAEELRQRMQQLVDEAEQVVQKDEEQPLAHLSTTELFELCESVLWRLIQHAYYADVLFTKRPLEREVYEEISARMMRLGFYERCLAYLEGMLERFPEERAVFLRRMGEVQLLQAERCRENEDEEQAAFYEEEAEESWKESLEHEDDFDTRIELVNLWLEQSEDVEEEEQRLDEAAEQLEQAKGLVTTLDQEIDLEYFLGRVAMARQQFQHALRHYQRIADIAPEDTHAWSDIGDAHRALGNIEEAETSYKRAIEREPHTPIHYSSLGLLYKEQGQFPKAIAVLEEGLRANPDSLNVHVYLIAAYLSQGDYQQAERFLDKAEQLAPGDEVLEDMRNEVTLRKRFDASKAKRRKRQN